MDPAPFPWIDVVIILALIGLNGLFAMSEIGLVTARKARLQVLVARLAATESGADLEERQVHEPARLVPCCRRQQARQQQAQRQGCRQAAKKYLLHERLLGHIGYWCSCNGFKRRAERSCDFLFFLFFEHNNRTLRAFFKASHWR